MDLKQRHFRSLTRLLHQVISCLTGLQSVTNPYFLHVNNNLQSTLLFQMRRHICLFENITFINVYIQESNGSD